MVPPDALARRARVHRSRRRYDPVGTFYALDQRDGTKLAEVAIGMAISGPAVSRGHIYVGSGDDLLGDPTAATRILSLGVGEDAQRRRAPHRRAVNA